MKKKAYLSPEVMVTTIHTAQLVMASKLTGTNLGEDLGVAEEDAPVDMVGRSRRRRRNQWDDEEEEDEEAW